MVHSSTIAAAASSSARPPRPRFASRLSSSLAFHAGAPITTPYYEEERAWPSAFRRHSSRYQTFPVPPPKTPSSSTSSTALAGQLSSESSDQNRREGERAGKNQTKHHRNHDGEHEEDKPLPWRQLILLAILSLAEQTALNSISPYLPEMVGTFPTIPPESIGLYVGLLASAFALAQLCTNFAWGYASDALGRKPILLLGTLCLAGCFAAFGFVKTFPAAVVVQALMGALNGNAAVVPTCLGEITTRSTQSTAFVWLPVMYSIGGITGPALGGLLVGDIDTLRWPFLRPNLCAAVALVAAAIIMAIWFEETLDNADEKAGAAGVAWLQHLCGCGRSTRNGPGKRSKGSWRSWLGGRGGHSEGATEGRDAPGSSDSLLSHSDNPGHSTSEDVHHDDASAVATRSVFKQLLNRTTVIVLATYLVFQLSNISFNSLYPIFASAPAPTGRDLTPGTIGVSLSVAGFVTIAFQVLAYPRLRSRVGNLGTYRLALLGMAISMALMPWVGYLSEPDTISKKDWPVYAELGLVLILKNICSVSGLSSAFLLITNSAPSHETLGTLNGIAQTLSAGGRSIGPFLSGGLFSLSTRVQPKGELLAWWLFGGITVVGWLGAFTIQGQGLESTDGGDDDDDSDDDHPEGAEQP